MRRKYRNRRISAAVTPHAARGHPLQPSRQNPGSSRCPAAQDLDAAAELNEQAKVLWQQGRYADAEALIKRSLDISEKTLGPDHIDVAHSLYELGYFYHRQSRYADAEPLYKRSIRRRSFASTRSQALLDLSDNA